MNVVIKYLSDLGIRLIEKGDNSNPSLCHIVLNIEIPKFLLHDFIEEGFVYQVVSDASPNVFYAPRDWRKADGSPPDKVNRFRNINVEVITFLHKALDTYKLSIEAGIPHNSAKQFLPSSNIINITLVSTKDKLENFANKWAISRQEEYNYYASRIKGVLNA